MNNPYDAKEKLKTPQKYTQSTELRNGQGRTTKENQRTPHRHKEVMRGLRVNPMWRHPDVSSSGSEDPLQEVGPEDETPELQGDKDDGDPKHPPDKRRGVRDLQLNPMQRCNLVYPLLDPVNKAPQKESLEGQGHAGHSP